MGGFACRYFSYKMMAGGRAVRGFLLSTHQMYGTKNLFGAGSALRFDGGERFFWGERALGEFWRELDGLLVIGVRF